MKHTTKTQSPASIRLKSGVRAIRIYPRPKSAPNICTVGLSLTSPEAIKLAVLLLAAALHSGWKQVNVTGFRDRNVITVTGEPIRKLES
jgi:hypothetical protein